MARWRPAAVALLLAAAPAPARSAPAPLARIFGSPSIAGTRPARAAPTPDGRRVAYVWNDRGLRSPLDLWLVEADGSGSPRNLTRFRDPAPDSPGSLRPWKPKKGEAPRRMAVEAFDWAPDGASIALAAAGDLYLAEVATGRLLRLTDTEAAESDPRFSPDGTRILFAASGNLFLLGLAPATRSPAAAANAVPALAQLTRAEANESYSGAIWSPDGARVAAVRGDEKERLDLLVPDYLGEKVSTSTLRGGWLREEAVVLEVAGGEVFRPDLGTEAPFSVSALRFSPDGRRLLVDGLSKNHRVRTLDTVDLGDAPRAVRRLDREEDPAWAFTFDWQIADEVSTSFSPAGDRVLFLSERRGFAEPYLVPADGSAAARPLRLSPPVFETSWADWMSDDRVLLLDARLGTERRDFSSVATATLVMRAEAPVAEPTAAVARTSGLNVGATLSRDRSRLVFERSQLDTPGDLWAIALTAGPASSVITRLTSSVPPGFASARPAVPRRIELVSRDGTRFQARVFEPKGRPGPGGLRPAVVFVHGAGYQQDVVDGWTIYWPNALFHQRLAERGYVVLEVDYRGSAGYGRAFRVDVKDFLGGRDLEDLLAGLAWLRARGDVGRVGVYGGSYGGFLALMALFREPAAFDAGAALRFVTDWENYFRGNPGYCVQRLGTPAENPEAYRRSSPIHFAAGLRAPLLLLHGVKDPNVHFQDAAQLTDRLIELGKDFELMIYPREGHGFERPESWIDEYTRIERFFDRHLAASAPASARERDASAGLPAAGDAAGAARTKRSR